MSKVLAVVLVVCAGAALAAGVAQSAPAQRSFDLQGHRGARGLAPENTLVAFARALGLGVTTLELDTVVTRDGVVVVSHDAALNPDLTRGPDGRWLEAPGPIILTLTRAELLRYDVGRTRPGGLSALRFPRATSRKRPSRRLTASGCASCPGP